MGIANFPKKEDEGFLTDYDEKLVRHYENEGSKITMHGNFKGDEIARPLDITFSKDGSKVIVSYENGKIFLLDTCNIRNCKECVKVFECSECFEDENCEKCKNIKKNNKI